jgi:hypothetical protein
MVVAHSLYQCGKHGTTWFAGYLGAEAKVQAPPAPLLLLLLLPVQPSSTSSLLSNLNVILSLAAVNAFLPSILTNPRCRFLQSLFTRTPTTWSDFLLPLSEKLQLPQFF